MQNLQVGFFRAYLLKAPNFLKSICLLSAYFVLIFKFRAYFRAYFAFLPPPIFTFFNAFTPSLIH